MRNCCVKITDPVKKSSTHETKLMEGARQHA